MKNFRQIKSAFAICILWIYFLNCGEATKELNQCKNKCDMQFTLCYLVVSPPTPVESSEGAVSGTGIILKTNTKSGAEWLLCYFIRESCLSSCFKTSSSSSTTRTTSTSRSSSSSSSSSGGGGSSSGGGAGGS